MLVNLKKTNEKLDIEKKKQGDLISSYNQEIKNLIAEQNQFATIRLSGIPMIADDMITFIKNDIVIFGFGVFISIMFLSMGLRNLEMGSLSINQLFFFYIDYGGFFRSSAMESYCYFFKFHRADADLNYFHEHSLPSSIHSDKK